MELFKREDRYDLYADDGSKIASTSPNPMKKLSYKNCQEIELTSSNEEYVLEVHGEGWDDHLYKGTRKQTKWEVIIEMKKVVDETKIINSVKGVKGSGHKITTYKSVPKIDADGCLILKKI
jgi:hypothetical protein